MPEALGERVVHGEVVLPDTKVLATSAQVVIRVEDVSCADAASRVVGELRIPAVSLSPGGRIPFSVSVPAHLIYAKNLYSVRVHVDVSGSGQVAVGDLVSTRSYPVLTRGAGDHAHVFVEGVEPRRRGT